MSWGGLKIPHGLKADDAHKLIDLDDSTFNEDERLATAALRDQHDAVLAELGDEHDPMRKEGKERVWGNHGGTLWWF